MDRLKLERLKNIKLVLWVLFVLTALSAIKSSIDLIDAGNTGLPLIDKIQKDAIGSIFWTRVNTCFVLLLSIFTLGGVIRSFKAVDEQLTTTTDNQGQADTILESDNPMVEDSATQIERVDNLPDNSLLGGDKVAIAIIIAFILLILILAVSISIIF